MAPDGDPPKTFFVGIGIGACALGLSLAFSLVIWVWSAGTQLVVGTMLVLLQILVAVIGLALTGWVCFKLWESVATRMKDLENRFGPQLEKLRNEGPAIGAAVTITGAVTVVIADKLFHGDELQTIVVGVVLLTFFEVANTLIKRRGWVRRAGYITWLGALAALPALVALHNGWAPRRLGTEIIQLPPLSIVAIALSYFVLALLPFTAPE
jgi:hypothetical protein